MGRIDFCKLYVACMIAACLLLSPPSLWAEEKQLDELGEMKPIVSCEATGTTVQIRLDKNIFCLYDGSNPGMVDLKGAVSIRFAPNPGDFLPPHGETTITPEYVYEPGMYTVTYKVKSDPLAFCDDAVEGQVSFNVKVVASERPGTLKIEPKAVRVRESQAQYTSSTHVQNFNIMIDPTTLPSVKHSLVYPAGSKDLCKDKYRAYLEAIVETQASIELVGNDDYNIVGAAFAAAEPVGNPTEELVFEYQTAGGTTWGVAAPRIGFSFRGLSLSLPIPLPNPSTTRPPKITIPSTPRVFGKLVSPSVDHHPTSAANIDNVITSYAEARIDLEVTPFPTIIDHVTGKVVVRHEQRAGTNSWLEFDLAGKAQKGP